MRHNESQGGGVQRGRGGGRGFPLWGRGRGGLWARAPPRVWRDLSSRTCSRGPDPRARSRASCLTGGSCAQTGSRAHCEAARANGMALRLPRFTQRDATLEYCVRSAARGARSSRRAPEHLMARARAEPLAQFGVRRERRILVGEDRPPVDRPPNHVVHRQNVQENTVQSQPKAAHTGTSATSCKSYHRFG